MIKLRGFIASDADLLVAYLNDEQVTNFITDAIPKPYTQEDANWWVETHASSAFTKAIEFNGKFVGCISAIRGEFEYSRGAELGYWIAREYWNLGIATEAVRVFGQTLLDSTDIIRLFVSVVSINSASIRVLEKNGYELEGILKSASFKNNRFYDEHLFSKVSQVDE